MPANSFHHGDTINLTMGPLGTRDGRIVLAVIQTLKTAHDGLKDGSLADLGQLLDVDYDGTDLNPADNIIAAACTYTGLDIIRHAYTVYDLLIYLITEQDYVTHSPREGGDLDTAFLAALPPARAAKILSDALFSLGDTIKFGDNYYRMNWAA